MAAAEKGKAAAGSPGSDAGGLPQQAAGDELQEDLNTCPIWWGILGGGMIQLLWHCA